MNFKLDHFESHFEDEKVFQGEDLFESGEVVSLNELERHLWILKVGSQKSYEVEILISPSKVKKYSCDCADYRSDGLCNHIVAGLYALRIQKNKEKKEREKKRQEKNRPQSIRIKDLIPQVNDEEIRVFLQKHLSKDRRLALSFKARFAQKITLSSERNKYLQILDELIKPVTQVKSHLRGDKISLFCQMADEFLAQFGDLISLGQIAEAFEVLSALITKTSYVCTNSTVFEDKLKSLNQKIHKEWWNYAQSLNAPELVSRQVISSSELAGNSYYNYQNADYDLYQFLYHHSSFIESSILDSLSFKIKKAQKDNSDSSYLLSIFFKLAYKIKDELFLGKITSIIKSRPDLLKPVTEKFLLKKEYELIDQFIKYMDETSVTEGIDLSTYRLMVFLHHGNTNKAKELIRHEYVLKRNHNIIRKLKMLDKKDKDEVVTLLEFDLYEKERYADLLELYDQCQLNSKLLKVLSKHPKIIYLEKFAYKFWESYEKEMIALHIKVYSKYLSTHVGYANSDYIANQLRRLQRNGWSKPARRIKEEVFRNYSTRLSLEKVFRNV